MEGNTENGGVRRMSRWRIAGWGTAAALMLLPLVAMQFSDEWNWDAYGFAFFATLLVAAGVTLALAARVTGDTAYRCAVGYAVTAAFILVWLTGAVGIIGTEDDDANALVFGVLAVGVIGTVLARFQPRGMARALVATALAQALVAVIALIAGLGSTGPRWPQKILELTGFFVALWLTSAWLFRKAARRRPETVEA